MLALATFAVGRHERLPVVFLLPRGSQGLSASRCPILGSSPQSTIEGLAGGVA